MVGKHYIMSFWTLEDCLAMLRFHAVV